MPFYKLPDSYENDLYGFETLIEDFLAGKIESIQFKAKRVPFGIYEQRKKNTFMMRIRSSGGAITPGQLKVVSDLSEKYCSELIHITTRQEVQLHNVQLKDVSLILKDLMSVGLSTRGGGGNTVRNIVASWNAGIDSEEFYDISPYVFSLTEQLMQEDDSWNLPRKFKLGLSGNENDTAGAIFQDLGFVARKRNGEYGFKVYVAGGLGAKPALGKVLHEFIPADEIYKVVTAVKIFFDKNGNRRNRHKARLRFLWEQLGKDKFLTLYSQELEKVKLRSSKKLTVHGEIEEPGNLSLEPIQIGSEQFALWKERYTQKQKQAGYYSVLIPIQNGMLKNKHARKIAEFAEKLGENSIRFTQQQNVTLRNIPEIFLGNVFVLAGEISSISKMPVFHAQAIACTGANTCKLGICLPRGLMDIIQKKMHDSGLDLDLIPDFKLNISGCPNACGKHWLGDLGFFGRAARQSHTLYPAYYVLFGTNRDPRAFKLAEKKGSISSYKLPEFLSAVLQQYIMVRDKHPTFLSYVDNGGQDHILQQLEKYSQVPEFEDDKNFYYDWGSSELFSLAGKESGECSAGMFDMIDHDLEKVRIKSKELTAVSDKENRSQLLYEIILYSSRMLLVTRGIEVRSEAEILKGFAQSFIDEGLISDKFELLVKLARDHDFAEIFTLEKEVLALAAAVEELYDSMDDSLRFHKKIDEETSESKQTVNAQEKSEKFKVFKDYRGVKCPLNFVKVKMELAKLQQGDFLKVLLDDGDPIESVPRSVKAEGHEIKEKTRIEDHWAILIEKIG